MAFCGYLRQGTAVDILFGPFLDDADGDTVDVDASLDVELSKNGQALADSESEAPSYDANGYYNCILGTTDTNTLGLLTVIAHHTDDLAIRQDYQVVTPNWFDSMCSTDKLDTSVVQILGTAIAESTGGNIATNFNTLFDDGDSAISTAIMSNIEELAAGNLPTDVGNIPTVMVGTDGANTTTPPTTTQIQDKLEGNGTSILDAISDLLPGSTIAAATDVPAMVGTNGAALATVLGSAVGASISVDIAAVKTDTASIQTETTALDTLTKASGPGDLAAVLADTGELQADDIPAKIAALQTDLDTITDTGVNAVSISTNAITASALNADAVTEIWSKAMSDLATGTPSSTASVLTAINYLYEAWRNKTTTTDTLITLMKDDGSTALTKSTISDDATTFIKGEMETGA